MSLVELYIVKVSELLNALLESQYDSRSFSLIKHLEFELSLCYSSLYIIMLGAGSNKNVPIPGKFGWFTINFEQIL